jgi:hypothetical protein
LTNNASNQKQKNKKKITMDRGSRQHQGEYQDLIELIMNNNKMRERNNAAAKDIVNYMVTEAKEQWVDVYFYSAFTIPMFQRHTQTHRRVIYKKSIVLF